jgi:5'-methylthioadenosine phosphorylase
MAAKSVKEVIQTASLDELCVGIIGGSGLDDPDILEDREEIAVDTPFGKPSDSLISGKIKGVKCALLARHGRKHTLYPTSVNFRANVYALKAFGCNHIIVSTACGSLKAEMEPGHLITIDQFIDRTTKRASTFYDGSMWEELPGVCHMPMADPFNSDMRSLVKQAMSDLDLTARFHETGTMVSIEGPRFSSKAESRMFQAWGANLINMTTVPEVCLANEAGLPYCAIAMSTDYDCWHEAEEPVTVEAVLAVMKKNSSAVKDVFCSVIPKLAETDWKANVQKAQDSANCNIMLY